MDKKFHYVLLNFELLYGIDLSNLQISYGLDDTSKIQIRKTNINLAQCNQDHLVQSVKWKHWLGATIPFLFNEIDSDSDVIKSENGNIIINYDIIASSFFLLSGMQELDKTKRDSLGRFNYKQSIQYRLNITTLPVVNYYFNILKEAIEIAYQVSLKLKFENNHAYTACLTHDIDNCENAWLEGSYNALLKGKMFTILNLLFHKFVLLKDKWYNFETIHAIEKEFNASSSFYFLCKKGKYLGKNNADYDVTRRKFGKVMDRIESLGSEVGIHGSFGTHLDLGLLTDDIRKLNRKVYGGRFHFLEFDITETTDVMSKAGLVYDSTLGFAEHPGFRNSFCYPFLLYDFKNDCVSHVWEIPLVLMDSSLQSTGYLNISPIDSRAIIDELINEVKKFKGIFTILWHTTFFSDYKYAGWRDVYFYFLNKCKEENAQTIHAHAVINAFMDDTNCNILKTHGLQS